MKCSHIRAHYKGMWAGGCDYSLFTVQLQFDHFLDKPKTGC